MTEREIAPKRLYKKLRLYQRRRILLWIWLLAELLILWIVNPTFIPAVSEWVTAIQTFFKKILWPHNLVELHDGTYRVYIYHFWNWLREMPFFPLLKIVVPSIIPACLLIVYIQIWFTKNLIRNVNKPPKEKRRRFRAAAKKPRKKRLVFRSVGPKVSGLYANNKLDAVRRFKALQESCKPLRESSVISRETDRGLWVSNMAPGAGGKIPADMIYAWDPCGIIEIKLKSNVLQFQLREDGVWMLTSDGFKQVLRKGVPLAVTHKNEAGLEILDMTVTWLGGIE